MFDGIDKRREFVPHFRGVFRWDLHEIGDPITGGQFGFVDHLQGAEPRGEPSLVEFNFSFQPKHGAFREGAEQIEAGVVIKHIRREATGSITQFDGEKRVAGGRRPRRDLADEEQAFEWSTAIQGFEV